MTEYEALKALLAAVQTLGEFWERVIVCMAIAITEGFDLQEAIESRWARRKRGATFTDLEMPDV